MGDGCGQQGELQPDFNQLSSEENTEILLSEISDAIRAYFILRTAIELGPSHLTLIFLVKQQQNIPEVPV